MTDDPMDSQEYVAAMMALQLNHASMSKLLDVEERTSRRYMDETRKIPGPVATLLRFMIKAKIKPQEVMRQLKRV